jgi:hypothetical protein
MKKFSFEIEISISDNWIKDGYNAKLIKEKLIKYIECEMNPYAYSHIEFKAKISPKKQKTIPTHTKPEKSRRNG